MENSASQWIAVYPIAKETNEQHEATEAVARGLNKEKQTCDKENDVKQRQNLYDPDFKGVTCDIPLCGETACPALR